MAASARRPKPDKHSSAKTPPPYGGQDSFAAFGREPPLPWMLIQERLRSRQSAVKTRSKYGQSGVATRESARLWKGKGF